MDHGHMDHGGMDMGHGPMCNMNVRQFPRLLCYTAADIAVVDAIHMGHNESLYNIPLVAHPLHPHAPHIPRRRRRTHSWL